jgi:hypothetical protein
MTGSLAFDGAVRNAIGSLIRNRSLSRSGGNILRSDDPAEAQMMTDWLCRQGEHVKIELEDTQTAVEMLRSVLIKQRSRCEQSNVHGCF